MFGSQSKLTLLGALISGAAFAQSPDVVEVQEGVSLEYSGERVYTIQPGDTLWDIANQFWEDSEQWPKMWSYNSYITNPHWIYPGNVISFTPGSILEPPTMDLEGDGGDDGYTVAAVQFEESTPECGPDVRFDGGREAAVYLTPGFLAHREMVESMGTVYGAKTGMTNLSEGDLVYLEIGEDYDFECGDVFSAYRRGVRVRHPEDRRLKYGYIHHIIAELRVIHVEGDIAAATIRRTYSALQRGDIIGPYVPVAAELPVRPPDGDLEGMIVARLGSEQTILAATGETVFIDRGEADGVGEGDAFFVIHRMDPHVSLRHYDERIPAQVAGRVIVTSVEEDHATAVVVDAASPIRVGDHISMSLE